MSSSLCTCYPLYHYICCVPTSVIVHCIELFDGIGVCVHSSRQISAVSVQWTSVYTRAVPCRAYICCVYCTVLYLQPLQPVKAVMRVASVPVPLNQQQASHTLLPEPLCHVPYSGVGIDVPVLILMHRFHGRNSKLYATMESATYGQCDASRR